MILLIFHQKMIGDGWWYYLIDISTLLLVYFNFVLSSLFFMPNVPMFMFGFSFVLISWFVWGTHFTHLMMQCSGFPYLLLVWSTYHQQRSTACWEKHWSVDANTRKKIRVTWARKSQMHQCNQLNNDDRKRRITSKRTSCGASDTNYHLIK